MTVAAIDWGLLGELVWAALLAGVAVALCFSLAVLGSARAGERRRAGQGGAAAAYATLAGVSLLAVAALIAFGLYVIIAG